MGSKTSPTAYFWRKIDEVLKIPILVCIAENKIERTMGNPYVVTLPPVFAAAQASQVVE